MANKRKLEHITRKPIQFIQFGLYIETDDVHKVIDSLSRVIEYWVKETGVKRINAESLGINIFANPDASDGICYSTFVYPQEDLIPETHLHNVN